MGDHLAYDPATGHLLYDPASNHLALTCPGGGQNNDYAPGGPYHCDWCGEYFTPRYLTITLMGISLPNCVPFNFNGPDRVKWDPANLPNPNGTFVLDMFEALAGPPCSWAYQDMTQPGDVINGFAANDVNCQTPLWQAWGGRPMGPPYNVHVWFANSPDTPGLWGLQVETFWWPNGPGPFGILFAFRSQSIALGDPPQYCFPRTFNNLLLDGNWPANWTAMGGGASGGIAIVQAGAP